MEGSTTTRSRSRSTSSTRKGEEDERRTTVVDPDQQEQIAQELEAQREESAEQAHDLKEAIDAGFQRMIDAQEETARRTMPMAPTQEQTSEAVKEGIEKAAGDQPGRVRRYASATWTVLKPRKPRMDDVAPIVYSNAATWGVAIALSQVSGGASDFFVELFGGEVR